MQNFYNLLLKCQSTTKLRKCNPLDSPDAICMLISNLPEKMRDKWLRAVMDVRRKDQREGTLCDFIKLIHEKTMLVNDILFSKETVDQYTDKKSNKQDNSKKRINTFSASSKYDKEEKRDVQKRNPLCIACSDKLLFDSKKVFI